MFGTSCFQRNPCPKQENPLRAGEGVRTLDNDIGNVVLCQLSYARKTRASEAFQAPNNARRRDYIKSFAPRKGYSQKSTPSRRVEVATLS